MKRTFFAIGIGVCAATVLVVVAIQSRSVSADVHIAQYSVAADTALVTEDFRALLDTLQAAWAENQAPGGAATSLANRVAAMPERIRESAFAVPGSTGQEARIRDSFASFASTVEQAGDLANRVIVDQTSFAEKIALLRSIGPQMVQRLRDMNLDRAAAESFQLVVGALSYAMAGQTLQETELIRMRANLESDQEIAARLPNEHRLLSDAIDSILATRPAAETRLLQLTGLPVANAAANLDLAVRSAYSSAVSRADRARWMMAAYSLALLASVAVVAMRLRESYQRINAANTDLAALNETLEQRVKDRTEKLEGTLADLKESQVQLVQAEKMSSLGQLVAGISHEINTPLLYLANNVELIRERLQNLQSFVRLSMSAHSMRAEDFASKSDFQKALLQSLGLVKKSLHEDALDEDVDDAVDLLEDCDEGLKDLTEMAQSLKDFSRLDRAPIAKFDVNSGLDKTLRIARNMVKNKAEVLRDYGEVPEISCSPSKINQVFLNLITNAAQAIEGNGTITLTTRRHDNQHVAIEVRDTGCGIPEDIIDKIRDPFFTTKDVGTGTGLGLSIVEEIIRGHGGELLIESKPGEGSAFTVVLPIKPPDSKQPQRPRSAPKSGSIEFSEPASGLARAS